MTIPWGSIIGNGINAATNLWASHAQGAISRQSLAQQLQQFREQQAFLQEQAARDQRNWEAQQAEDQRRYDEMMGMQREQWQAQQQLRAPYRAASQRLLNGAFGDTSVIRPYPGASLGDLMPRG